jgi:MFS family permease
VTRHPLDLLRHIAVDVRPLRHKDFRRLFIGQGVSFVGFQLTAVAVPVQMFAITRSSFWVGLLGLAALVPLVIFGLYGGAVSDAFDRRRLYIWSSCIVWAATGALLLQALLHAHSRVLLLAVVAVQTVGFSVSAPVRGAITPRLIPPEEVAAGNTLNFTMSNAGTVAGPLIAGVVIARGGYAWAYGIDAALFTVGLYAALRLPPIPPLGEKVRPGVRAVLDGLSFIATRPVLLGSFAVDIAAMVLAMPRALFPQVAVDRFHDVGAVGWLYASIAIGSIVAGLGSGWIGRVRRQGRALVFAVVVWGVAVAAAGLAHQLWLAVLLLAFAGAGDLVSAVYRQTILQTYAPDEMRGRMQGVFTVVVAGGPRLGDLRAGLTAGAAGLTVSWVAGGVACVVVVVILAAAIPALWHYRVEGAAGRTAPDPAASAAPGEASAGGVEGVAQAPDQLGEPEA